VRPTIDAAFQRLWYGRSPLAWLWLPLSWVFVVVTADPPGLYRAGIILAVRVAKPVIVVGNITVWRHGKNSVGRVAGARTCANAVLSLELSRAVTAGAHPVARET